MMFTIAKASWILLLFIFSYICLKYLLMSLIRQSVVRSRLSARRAQQIHKRWNFIRIRQLRLVIHLSDLLESVSSKLRVGQLLSLCLVLAVSGVLMGTLYFSSIKGVVSLSTLLALLPYIVLRMRLLTLQMKNRTNFLPALEVFYQSYVLAEHKNIRTILKSSLEENRMMYPMKAAFEQLYLGLMVHKDMEACLRIFVMTLGNQWAEHYASILRFGLIEGVDLTANLKELIGDMRKAGRADQIERNRLLEIRIANFSPIVFLMIFLGINFKLDFQSAYSYYFMSKLGRDMLLDSIILIGASFLMGIYLSMRRM